MKLKFECVVKVHTIFGVANDLTTVFLIRKYFSIVLLGRLVENGKLLRMVKVMAHTINSLCQAVNQISSKSKCLGIRRRSRIASKHKNEKERKKKKSGDLNIYIQLFA